VLGPDPGSATRRVTASGIAAVAASLSWLVACAGSGTESSPAPILSGISWTTLLPAPTPRAEVAAATDGSRVFVVGGFAADGGTLATVEVLDPETELWSEAPDLPIAVNHPMAAGLDGTVYVVGGYLGPGLTVPTDRAFALREGGWEELPPMPEVRAAGGAAAVDGRLYVAGGVGPEGLGERMLVFDPDTRVWSTLDGPPTAREHLGVAGSAGGVYVVGGRTGGIGSNLNAAEVFDVAAGEWTELPGMPTPRGGIAAGGTDRFVVAAGGEADVTFGEAEAFDVQRRRWVAFPNMPTPRHGVGVVAVDDVLYVIDGGVVPGLSVSNTVEAIDLTGLS
jgi:N-acetylneuraminic acid mutarotase